MSDDESSTDGPTQKRSKHAPAVMRSNKEVSILRVQHNVAKTKRFDPRFSDLSGKLNQDKFMESYKFLDENQENEVNHLEKKIKKIKNEKKKLELKTTLQKYLIYAYISIPYQINLLLSK